MICIDGVFLFGWSILWFDPRREHSSVPTAKSHSRRAEGLSRLAASSRPPEGLGLDWPEHGGTLDWIGAGGCGKLHPGGSTLVVVVLPTDPSRQVGTGRAGAGRADVAEIDAIRACRIGKTGTAPI